MKNAEAGAGATEGRSLTYRPLLLCGILLCLTLVGAWTYRALRDNLSGQIAAELQRVLTANVVGLQIWIEGEKGDVQIMARDPEIRSLVSQLKKIAETRGAAPGRLRSAPQQALLSEALSPAVADIDYRGFAVIDPTGLILASDALQAYVAHKVSATLQSELKRVWSGETFFIPPLAKNRLVQRQVVQNAPMIIVAAPVRDPAGRVIAALAFTIDPEENFSRILSAARAGDTGDTYAFDKDGFLLSETRHEKELKPLGLVPRDAAGSSVLAVQVRDPGGDLTQGFQLREPPARRPLTRMAASAISGASGVDVRGYRDYRGVKVIGAWRWLPDYRFGIATEWEYREVMQALTPVRYAFWGLMGAVALLAVTSAAGSWWIRRLRRRIGILSQLGQYTLLEKIGEGGMGQVYLARHALLRRPTAIKFIPEDVADAATLARFEREVQITSELTHPNTVSIFDYGRTAEGVFFYVMEYLPGITLQQLVELQGALPVARVVHVLSQICASLQEAHGRGLVHRDINPRNVILCERGGIYDFVKVVDFGLVKDVASQRDDLAAPGYVFGAPGFVAPERLTAPHVVSIASDLYSVGAVGYFLLTSKTVLSADFSFDPYSDMVRGTPRRPSDEAPLPVARELDDLIFACLQKDPASRPQSAEEIRKRLEMVESSRWSEGDAALWWRENAERVENVRKGKDVAGLHEPKAFRRI